MSTPDARKAGPGLPRSAFVCSRCASVESSTTRASIYLEPTVETPAAVFSLARSPAKMFVMA